MAVLNQAMYTYRQKRPLNRSRYGQHNTTMPKTSSPPWQPEQTTLLSPSPSAKLADANEVFALLDLVDELNHLHCWNPAQSKVPI